MLAAYGSGQRGKIRNGWVALVFAVIIAAGAVAFPPEPGAQVRPSPAGAEAWSEARVASYIAQGHPVFVYFTADWCLTCKANEAAAIDRAEVRDAFRKADVKVLAGDWTNGDPAITRFLEGRGRAGVPLYLWYAPGREPEELPQILTPSMLISRAQSAR
jgi:thiol:disulfide interchange protein